MGFLQELGRKISHAIAVATDWLLIGMGILLVLIALVKIDVQLARYVVIAGGLVLSGFGLWFRWRRLRRG
ncbi:hypothetical protein VU01_10716 [Candidatus Electrothrix marina]|uniref:Uncharacterized protein n=2 Tax=Candidatus Electrothrix TaxID=1859128 RepID=A0A3S3SQJ8_9BACT|nr:hypothetical protein VT98_12061 [Candidatus Electrothrix communis]RWX47839.1 hypothetical protein VT99_11414 [Candidatus Electrothrix marina]RWX51859.1 hypothetical protein VU01_10716 [Candidatus Electrothrix marina]